MFSSVFFLFFLRKTVLVAHLKTPNHSCDPADQSKKIQERQLEGASHQLEIRCKSSEETVGDLTDVWVLEQSADPGFSLQLLVVYKTIKPQHISALDKHGRRPDA